MFTCDGHGHNTWHILFVRSHDLCVNRLVKNIAHIQTAYSVALCNDFIFGLQPFVDDPLWLCKRNKYPSGFYPGSCTVIKGLVM